MTESPWRTAKEAAAYVRLEHKYFLVKARKGLIKGYQPSGADGHWLFHTDDLDAYIRGQKPKGNRLRAA